jgi:predicted chitinase
MKMKIQYITSLLNQAMNKFEINTCMRKVHFLAQIACEGDMFRTTEEYKNRVGSIPKHWNSYRGGPEYHGRGLIQLTHIDNYASYGATIGVEFNLKNLNLVASKPEHVINSAAWYWLKGSSWGSGNKYSDLDDVHYITILVNGGFNHYCDRKRNLLNLIEKMEIRTLCVKAMYLGDSLGVMILKQVNYLKQK